MADRLIELHCHSDGLLDPALLRALLAAGHELPVRPADLDAVWPVASFAEWTGRYQPVVAPALAPPAGQLPIYAAHVKNLIRQGVGYAELMVSGLLMPRGGGSVVERFRAVRAAVDEAAGGQIQVELLACFGRGSLERALAQTERILEVARAGLIVGVALAGDETACSVRSLAPALDRLRDAGLGIEIHAGEHAGPESVWDALEHGRPRRIGHGVRAFEDPRLLDALRERDVHLELCPTSNLRLGVVRELREHPVGRALALSLSFSINSDDPGPFGCSVASEFALVEQAFGLTPADRAKILANSWRARFGR